MIEGGLPDGEEGWPAGVLDGLREWEQGDVVASPPFFYFADPQYPIWKATRAYTDTSAGPELIIPPDEVLPPYGLVTSQTCDIAEDDRSHPKRPWVQIAPVYPLEPSWRKKLRQGRGPRYWLPLPGLDDGDWMVDLRIEYPVEKGWLAQQTRIVAFPDPDDRARLGARLSWLRGRPAFSPEFVTTVQSPLFGALDHLDSDESDIAARILAQLSEVMVRVDNLLHPRSVRLAFLTETAFDADVEEWFQAWRDDLLAATQRVGLECHALASMHRTASGVTAP